MNQPFRMSVHSWNTSMASSIGDEYRMLSSPSICFPDLVADEVDRYLNIDPSNTNSQIGSASVSFQNEGLLVSLDGDTAENSHLVLSPSPSVHSSNICFPDLVADEVDRYLNIDPSNTNSQIGSASVSFQNEGLLTILDGDTAENSHLMLSSPSICFPDLVADEVDRYLNIDPSNTNSQIGFQNEGLLVILDGDTAENSHLVLSTSPSVHSSNTSMAFGSPYSTSSHDSILMIFYLSPPNSQIGSANGSLQNEDFLPSLDVDTAESEFGFFRSDFWADRLVGTVDYYDRHVFLCYKNPEVWPPHIEAGDSDSQTLPRLLSAAFVDRKGNMKKQVCGFSLSA